MCISHWLEREATVFSAFKNRSLSLELCLQDDVMVTRGLTRDDIDCCWGLLTFGFIHAMLIKPKRFSTSRPFDRYTLDKVIHETGTAKRVVFFLDTPPLQDESTDDENLEEYFVFIRNMLRALELVTIVSHASDSQRSAPSIRLWRGAAC